MECECGCGQLTTVRRCRAARFIHGHVWRGRRHTAETRERMQHEHRWYRSSRPRRFNYANWHTFLRKSIAKTGICVNTVAVSCRTWDGRAPTHWSYTGNDPRGWEPDETKYIEECTSCNLRRRTR